MYQLAVNGLRAPSISNILSESSCKQYGALTQRFFISITFFKLIGVPVTTQAESILILSSKCQAGFHEYWDIIDQEVARSKQGSGIERNRFW